MLTHVHHIIYNRFLRSRHTYIHTYTHMYIPSLAFQIYTTNTYIYIIYTYIYMHALLRKQKQAMAQEQHAMHLQQHEIERLLADTESKLQHL